MGELPTLVIYESEKFPVLNVNNLRGVKELIKLKNRTTNIYKHFVLIRSFYNGYLKNTQLQKWLKIPVLGNCYSKTRYRIHSILFIFESKMNYTKWDIFWHHYNNLTYY